jgi:hypothetical protein
MRIYQAAILTLVVTLGACKSYEAPIADQGDQTGRYAAAYCLRFDTLTASCECPTSSPIIVNSDGSACKGKPI